MAGTPSSAGAPASLSTTPGGPPSAGTSNMTGTGSGAGQ
jgi:hypothetical protein